MTSDTDPRPFEQELFDAAVQAASAPSVHNTQPWHFEVRAPTLQIWADPDRRLPVIDPHGRQLAISCGTAVFAARVALAAAGFEVAARMLPDPSRPNLVAALTVSRRALPYSTDIAALEPALERRRSNRRAFAPEPVPPAVVTDLIRAAAIEGAGLHEIVTLDDRVTVATLTQHADSWLNADPAYRTELRAWTGDRTGSHDGVPAAAIPRRAGEEHDDIPIRDFDTTGAGGLPGVTDSRLTQTLLVLGTDQDDTEGWLTSGQALCRVLLELTRAGYVASIFSQPIEVPGIRQQLQRDLRLSTRPHLLLRVGHAEATPTTPRRPADEIVSVGPPETSEQMRGPRDPVST